MKTKYYSFKKQTICIVLGTIIILSSIAVFTFNRLNFIINSVAELTKPDQELVFLKQFHTELSDAESAVKSYVLTHNKKQLIPFYTSVDLIHERMLGFEKICDGERNQHYLVDSMRILLLEKSKNLSELLKLSNDNGITNELNKISKKIAQIEPPVIPESQINKSTDPKQTPEKKKTFFSKIFKKKQKTPLLEIKEDTLKPIQISNLESKKIIHEIDLAKENQLEQILNRKNREFELVQKDEFLMSEIRKIISQVENQKKVQLANKTSESKILTRQTKWIVTGFCVLAILLLCSASYLVVYNIKKSNSLRDKLQNEKDDVENLSIAKEQFLASMSHEIRTPLNGIIGFTKILLRNGGFTEKQKHQMKAIKTSSDILLVLINDILDLSKIEAGKMTIESTELKLVDLVDSILDTFEIRFKEKSLIIKKYFDRKIPPFLLGDPIRINQILLNILSNSVKFTDQGGEINIKVSLLKEDDEQIDVQFVLSDTGIGIASEKLETIFEPFVQSDEDTTRKYGGTGLGLGIVKKLVGLMNGSISVESGLGKGSTFKFVIPFKKTNDKELFEFEVAHINPNEKKSLGKLKVLLVEDIRVNQFLAQTILHDFGFESDTAENGQVAIEFLEKNDYDIILMDLMMPIMNGYEATTFIRTQLKSEKSKIPILALTADVSKYDLEKCIEVGMNDYVLKPINEIDLLNKIYKLVSESKTKKNEKL